ncbi:MAG: DUF4243 domain-containing protein [Myxococcales bacterium]|nr:DUF4243 domain-containing protein [Myxococcales bacterium]
MTLAEHRRTTASVASSPLVEQELERDREFHPNLGGVTRGGLANHFPMTVLALHGLGASDDEVEAFKARWPRHRASITGDLRLADDKTVTVDNWPDFLGEPARLAQFRRVFEELLATERERDVVTHALWVMRDGLPMGLFHPLIRLSFASQHGSHGLIADALAYMAIRHEDLFRSAALPVVDADHAEPSAGSVWRRAATDEDVRRARSSVQAGSLRVCEELCGERVMHSAALTADFAIGGGALSTRIPEICRLALRLYLFEPALTTLHAVTAAQALADLTLRYGDGDAATFSALWARYWVWLTTLYVEKGRPTALPALDEASPRSVVDWEALSRAARAIPEVHLVKMTYTCRWLDETFGPEPLYALAVRNMLREQNAHPKRGAGLVPRAL